MKTPDDPTSNPRSGKRPWARLALALILGIHTVQAVRLFPSLRSIVDPDSPVVVVDHAIHEYHGDLGARFVRESGTSWGFDPFFMAGYPETPVWDSSSNPSILFDLIGGRAGGFRSYKVGLLICSILVVVMVPVGAWAAGLRAWEITIASALAWVTFWVGFPIALWRSGLFAFVTASAGSGLLLGLCSRFDRQPTRAGWIALTLVGSSLFFVHVTTPIVVIGGLMAFLATVGLRHKWRWWLAIVGAGGLAVLVNLPWLANLWRFRALRTPSALFMTTNSALYLLDYLLRPSIEGRLALVLLILGFTGLATWWFAGRRGSAAAIGGAIVTLIVLTGFGSLWEPTKNLEPLRFRVPFLFLLAIPAGSAVVEATGSIARRLGGRRRGAIVAGVAWVAVLGTWGSVDRRILGAAGSELIRNRPLVVGIKPEMAALVHKLRTETDRSGRILFEDQLRLLEPTDPESVHWTPMLPSLLHPDDRLFIGGLYQTAFIRHHQVASFGDFQLGGRYIDQWTSAEVRRYCEAYNVGWVVCWSPLSRFWFDRFEPAKRVATVPRYGTPNRPLATNEHEWMAMIRRAGIEVAKRYMLEGDSTYAIYRVDRPRSYFLKGRGRLVAVEPNRVEFADVEPDAGSVVVSLHWLDTWTTDSSATLRPEPMPPDPVPFVRVDLPGPTPRLVLSNRYGRP